MLAQCSTVLLPLIRCTNFEIYIENKQRDCNSFTAALSHLYPFQNYVSAHSRANNHYYAFIITEKALSWCFVCVITTTNKKEEHCGGLLRVGEHLFQRQPYFVKIKEGPNTEQCKWKRWAAQHGIMLNVMNLTAITIDLQKPWDLGSKNCFLGENVDFFVSIWLSLT